jgi:hypothetical protein
MLLPLHNLWNYKCDDVTRNNIQRFGGVDVAGGSVKRYK